MELDRISKHILTKMAQMEEATASELRDALGLEQNQSVHYRMDQKLIPNGYVYENPQRREQPGSRKPARVYEIEPKGKEWVEDHGHEVTLTDIDEAEQEIQRLTAEFRSLSDDIQKLKRWRQEQSGHSGGVKNRLSDLSDDIEELQALMDKHERRDYSGIWDQLHSLGDRADDLERRFPDEPPATAADIEQVQSDIRSLNNRLDSLESNLDDVEGTQSDYNEWAHQLEARVQELENRTLLDYLLPWR